MAWGHVARQKTLGSIICVFFLFFGEKNTKNRRYVPLNFHFKVVGMWEVNLACRVSMLPISAHVFMADLIMTIS